MSEVSDEIQMIGSMPEQLNTSVPGSLGHVLIVPQPANMSTSTVFKVQTVCISGKN